MFCNRSASGPKIRLRATRSRTSPGGFLRSSGSRPTISSRKVDSVTGQSQLLGHALGPLDATVGTVAKCGEQVVDPAPKARSAGCARRRSTAGRRFRRRVARRDGFFSTIFPDGLAIFVGPETASVRGVVGRAVVSSVGRDAWHAVPDSPGPPLSFSRRGSAMAIRIGPARAISRFPGIGW
ncbi:MAG: hypothetical protein CM1200mP2_04830 [Planctomycetaceae bacterium]|nr:MAG: hypothetical protein CM1200mP2_04830 [Planctomycetaceae bacterium]